MNDTRINCIEVIDELSAESISKVINQLSEEQIVIDEHCTFLGKQIIVQCLREVENLLRLHGYNGGELKTIAHYYPEYGEIIGVFNTQELNYDQAKKYLDGWRRNSKF